MTTNTTKPSADSSETAAGKKSEKLKETLAAKFCSRFSIESEEKLLSILKSTAFKVKDGEVTDEQMQALLIVSDQYGLNPFTKEIFAYPDKNNGIVPVVSIDGWLRIINQHPMMDGMNFENSNNWLTPDNGKTSPEWMECILYRKDRNHPVRIKEYLDEVYRAPFEKKNQNNGQTYLVNGPWQTHTKRIMRHKSLIQCARYAFGFAGLYDEDEALRILEDNDNSVIDVQAEVINSEPVKLSNTDIKTLDRLTTRCITENSWQGAIDWINSNRNPELANVMVDALNKNKNDFEKGKLIAPNATQTQSQSQSTLVSNQTSGDEKDKGTDSVRKTNLDEARKRLN
ncbi:phage recombination protein Bet [Methylomonas sp. AM2-LC]|uniref:phage recombination protein Bet n=1 Tax=Methylomonas sp. AM2-LC TaxID=3153301 RepID=UPI0032670024